MRSCSFFCGGGGGQKMCFLCAEKMEMAFLLFCVEIIRGRGEEGEGVA